MAKQDQDNAKDQTIGNMNNIPRPDMRVLNDYRDVKNSSAHRGPKPGDREEDLGAIGLQGAIPEGAMPQVHGQEREPEVNQLPDWRDELRDALNDLPEEPTQQP